MKHLLYCSISVLFCVFILLGCKNEEEPYMTLETTGQVIEIPQSGNQFTLNLKTNTAWTALVSGSGFTVNPSSGSGDAVLQVTAAENPTADNNVGSLTVRSATLAASISLVQAQKDALTAQGDATIGPAGGKVSFSVSHNVAFSCTIEESAKSWISLANTKGMQTSSLDFLVAENTTYGSRTGSITVEATGTTLPAQTLHITQTQNNAIIVGSDTLNISCEESLFNIEVQHNLDFSCEILDSWIHNVDTKGLTSTTLYYSAEANMLPARRTGRIVYTLAADNLSDTVIVNQAGISPMVIQKNALKALYQALDGASWSGASNWNTSADISTWEGVNMSGDLVTGLNLSGFGLKGSLTDDILILNALENLDLSNNPELKGIFPESISSLVNLKNLSLSSTGFAGIIPKQWESFTAMETVDLSSTGLETPLPEEVFTAWKHISSINISENSSLTGDLPEFFGKLTTDADALSLQMQNCNFAGGIPDSWANMTEKCKVLLLYGNTLTEKVPWLIQKHPNWTTDKWDRGDDNIRHYIRSQQNDIFLDLEPEGGGYTQRELLMMLYNALDGENWTKKTNWNTSEEISTWQGVTLNEEGKVIKLALNGAGLKGSLPDAIGFFTSLESLNIGSNPDLTGELPDALGKLVNLTSFLAVSTSLEGNLPSSMGEWKQVTNIQLNNNKITGTIPAAWAGMTALKTLGLSNTLISTPIPDELFTSWKHLGSLLLNKNPNMTGPLPESVGSITTDNTMLSIWFSECNFSGGIPSAWAGIPSVSKQLRVYGNQLTEAVPLVIQEHPCWTADRWDSGSASITHYIRSQQNDVFLELEKKVDPAAPQREALVAIYNALGGSGWTKQENWLSDQPISSWEGVETDADGMVIKLTLSNRNLQGSLPEDLADLSRLTSLSIGSNPGIIGSLPAAISKLTELEAFTAATTSLSGTLPPEMGNLKKLTNLQLNNNNISGTIPAEWAGMENIQNLGLYGTQLSTPIPDILFQSWKHIGMLLLNKNPNMTGALPQALGYMTTDQSRFSIQIHECNFTGGIPKSYGNIPSVSTQLFLYGNALTEKVPKSVQNHPSWVNNAWKPEERILPQQNDVILELESEDNPYESEREILMEIYNALGGANMTKKNNWGTDADLSQWEGVKVRDGHVHKLDISNCNANGAFPKAIAYLYYLDTLFVNTNPNLKGPLPEELGNLTQIRTFNLVSSGIDGPLPKGMGKWKKLINLQMGNAKISGPIPAEWAGMESLVNLGMYNTGLTGPFPEEIFTGWKHIASILWHKNKGLTGNLPEGLGRMTTDQERFNIHLHECNFTGGIPRSYGSLPSVSQQIYLNDNQLTEPVPKEMQLHPSWTSGTWNITERILPQQNGVVLTLEAL